MAFPCIKIHAQLNLVNQVGKIVIRKMTIVYVVTLHN